ncbi:16S rRNA (uracil(1498)-N(3))-methyltransferase [Phreatobacter sp.]|uniref:16S rRNA (uracil(1498)-N(3))-methyltransferase n=1 Tax=Phreatobacter sp. TaxID=1966341 RepID=UPI003F723082
MAPSDFAATRLFVDAPLDSGAIVALDRGQTNFLANVLRLRAGDRIAVFNGRDGEWAAVLSEAGRKAITLVVGARLREQPPPADLTLLFAPLKHARLDYMVQKAVEMGASRLVPVMTRRTQASRVNHERMQANIVEAAEQCGILALPVSEEAVSLDKALAGLERGTLLVFCDEGATVADPVAVLRAAAHIGPVAVLVGPEGGFAPEEREALAARPDALAISLGPRILRADTAAVAALAVVQAAIGDWRGETGLS